MSIDVAVRRAQVYRFLADAFLYTTEDWTQDLPLLSEALRELNAPVLELEVSSPGAAALRAEHRRVFGLTGSLCYETEYGLPHEFRQSQELADLAGFYRAFGFTLGGPVHERPDHAAAELEFMYALTLKEAQAAESGFDDQVEVCADAERKFLGAHLATWIDLFAEALERLAAQGPYVRLARFAAAFVRSDAERLGLAWEPRPLQTVKPTPLGPELPCEGCGAL